MSELKKCPFCGGDAALGTTKYSADSDTAKLNHQTVFHSVNCVVCGSSNRGLIGFKTEQGAIRHWNNRVTP